VSAISEKAVLVVERLTTVQRTLEVQTDKLAGLARLSERQHVSLINSMLKALTQLDSIIEDARDVAAALEVKGQGKGKALVTRKPRHLK
jgi:hypothetical protein